MKSPGRFLLLVSALLLVAGATFAQGTTGAMNGTVVHQGAPLPGVTVTISSPALQGTRVAVTNVNGDFNLPALPPGQYTVVFEMEGMASVTQVVRVTLAQTARVNAELQLSAVAEQITVTASANAVLETTEVETNIQKDLVENLPMGRNLLATADLAPGVTRTGAGNQYTISGGFVYDSVFLVNGVVVNENLRGQPHDLFIEDAIQETTVMTGGISAEYGRFTGGVVSAISKSGGNEFSGSIRNNMDNPSWTKDSPLAPATKVDEINHVQEATLGGRILRDRLWFFAAGIFADESIGRALTQGGPSYEQGLERNRYEGKLTGQLTGKHSLVASFLDATVNETNNCQSQVNPCFALDAVDPSRELPNDFLTAHYNGILTGNFLLEASYAEKTFQFVGSGGEDPDRVTGSPIRNFAEFSGMYNEPYFCGICTPESRNSDQWNFKGTYYLGTATAGTHNVTAGYEQWHETRVSNNYQSPSDFVILNYTTPPVRDSSGTQVTQTTFDPGDIIVWYPILQQSLGSDFNTLSAFLNDKWDLNRYLSFNLGVRWDKNDGTDAAGNKVADDDNYSPRLGMIYDLRGDGTIRLSASYSRYVGRLADSVASAGSVAGRPATYVWEYDGDPLVGTPSQAMTALFNWFDGIGGLNNTDNLTFVSIPGATVVIDGSLNSPYSDEITFGVGTQLGSNGFARVDYITKEWGDFYTIKRDTTTGTAISNPATGARADKGVVINSEVYERTYDAIQIQAQYRLFDGRLATGLNYTWSELKGDIEGETFGSGPVTTGSTTSYPEYAAFAQANPSGFLSADQTHKASLWASYDLPTPIGNFNFSAIQRFQSGQPYSAAGSIRIRNYVTNPGYLTPPSTTNYYFSDRGEYRWDDWTATDLAVNYALPIWKLELFLQGEVMNVFDEDAQINGNSTVYTGANSGRGLINFDPFTTTPIECPQGASASTCADMGAHWQKAASFGQPSLATTGDRRDQIGDFQVPLTYRFSVGLRF